MMILRSTIFAATALLCCRTLLHADSFTFKPLPDDQYSSTVDVGQIDNAGYVVAGVFHYEPQDVGIFSPNGNLTLLPDFPTGECSTVTNNCMVSGAAINNKGLVVGTTSGPLTTVQYDSPNHQEAFLWVNNAWTTIKSPIYNPNDELTHQVDFKGMNQAGQIVATYGHFFEYHNDPTNYQEALNGSFLWQNGTSKKIIDPNQASGTVTLVGGINDSGEIVGSYQDKAGITHGFVDKSGVFHTLDVPGATSTQLALVNDPGQIVGSYLDSAGVSHQFLFSNGKFLTIAVPDSTQTTITALNNKGELVGYLGDLQGGFVYDNGTYQIIKLPGQSYSYLQSVNDSGDILGYVWPPYGDVSAGFIGYPDNASAPEPGSLGLLITAFTALAALLLGRRNASGSSR